LLSVATFPGIICILMYSYADIYRVPHALIFELKAV